MSSPLMSRIAPAAPASGVVIKLTKPVEGHHGLIREIVLKEPTFGDWVECGDMFKRTLIKPAGDGIERMSLDMDTGAVARWFHRLSGQPSAVLAQLSYQDAMVIYNHVQLLVGDTSKGNSPTPPTSSG